MGKKIPETISNEKMAGLRWRAEKANKESMFSRRNVDRRLKSNDQRDKKGLS